VYFYVVIACFSCIFADFRGFREVLVGNMGISHCIASLFIRFYRHT